MRTWIVVAFVLLPQLAIAHIHMTFPEARTDALTGDQKVEHCGTVNWVRADHPDRNNVFLPGSTITVTWLETINHPGHYRIAFQPNGEVFGVPQPAAGLCKGSIACPVGVTNCEFPAVNQEGTDPVNGSIVLKDLIADGMLSTQITLPNIECANCTLQVIQLMTDKCPYTANAQSDDIYFKCADITLSASAPDAGPQPGVDAGPTGPDAGNANNPDAGGGCGGCSTGASGGFAVVAFLAGLRRRRR